MKRMFIYTTMMIFCALMVCGGVAEAADIDISRDVCNAGWGHTSAGVAYCKDFYPADNAFCKLDKYYNACMSCQTNMSCQNTCSYADSTKGKAECAQAWYDICDKRTNAREQCNQDCSGDDIVDLKTLKACMGTETAGSKLVSKIASLTIDDIDVHVHDKAGIYAVYKGSMCPLPYLPDGNGGIVPYSPGCTNLVCKKYDEWLVKEAKKAFAKDGRCDIPTDWGYEILGLDAKNAPKEDLYGRRDAAVDHVFKTLRMASPSDDSEESKGSGSGSASVAETLGLRTIQVVKHGLVCQLLISDEEAANEAKLKKIVEERCPLFSTVWVVESPMIGKYALVRGIPEKKDADKILSYALMGGKDTILGDVLPWAIRVLEKASECTKGSGCQKDVYGNWYEPKKK